MVLENILEKMPGRNAAAALRPEIRKAHSVQRIGNADAQRLYQALFFCPEPEKSLVRVRRCFYQRPFFR